MPDDSARLLEEALPICGGSERVVKFGVGCGKPITSVDDLYRCATCTVPMHLDCLRRHFGPGDGPIPTRVEEIARKLFVDDAELQQLREALARAAYVSRHLLEAADDSVFEGAIGPEGQRESDYRISMLAAEIREWAALAGSTAARDNEVPT